MQIIHNENAKSGIFCSVEAMNRRNDSKSSTTKTRINGMQTPAFPRAHEATCYKLSF
jgi:hypothetical protein